MKDVNAPTRFKTSYMLFCDANRKETTQNNPDMSMVELSAVFGQLWGEATDKDKAPFVKQSDKLKAKWEKKMNAYKKTEEYADFQKRKQTDKLIRKYASQLGINKKTEFTRFPADPNAPKRPMTSFFCFAEDERVKLAKTHPDNNVPENAKILAQRWKDISEIEKAKYEKMAEQASERHDEAVEKYKRTKKYKKYMKVRDEYYAEKKTFTKATIKK